MKTTLSSISKIFTEKLFRIPDYQRGYAWTEKQLKDFWNDILQLEKDKNHYVGVLTLESVPEEKYKLWNDDVWIIESKSFDPYYIVDGQQRLTTTIILVQSIIERIGKKGILNYTSYDEIVKKFIFESKDGGISKSYIFGYEIDNPSHEFLKKNIFQDTSDSSDLTQETIYTHNLEFAKNFFIEKLKELSIEDIEVIYKKITQHLLFNIYSMSEDIDVYVAFETMNNRGKPLSHLELLKNRLIFLSTKFNTGNHEKSRLRNAINECWKVIYHQLGKNKQNPLDDDFFLHNHFILYFSDSLNKDKYELDYEYSYLHRHYRNTYKDYLLEEKFISKNIESNKITISDVYLYVRSLKLSVEIWYQILNPEESKFDDNEKLFLKRIGKLGIFDVAPLIMIFFQENSNKKLRIDFLMIIERYLFISDFFFYGSRYNQEKIFLELSGKLNKSSIELEKVIATIQNEINKILSDETIRTTSKRYKDNGYYQSRIIRYFLYEYEISLKEKSKTKRDKIIWEEYFDEKSYIFDNKSVEHIYPQHARRVCWNSFKRYDASERKILRHVIGNLVPLSSPKNSSLGNKCFKEKLGNDVTMIGYKYGSFSENELTNYTEWTAIEILQRSIKLIVMLSKRWSIKFKNTKDIIKFLNLEFVVKKEKLIIDEKKRTVLKND
jgi:uncharacterized protein with ParB-like and HNH nuclease domain